MKSNLQKLMDSMQYAIFDLDGTLIDSMSAWSQLGENYLKQKGIVPDNNLKKKLKTMSLAQSSKYFTKHYRLPNDSDSLLREMLAMITEEYHQKIPLKPYAKEFLEALYQNGIRMCIATASEKSLALPALERLEILPYFEFILTCSDIGKSKETPDIFYEAMHRLGGNQTNTVVFEDSYFSILSAKQGKFPVIGIYDEYARPEEAAIRETVDGYIRDFSELLQIPV